MPTFGKGSDPTCLMLHGWPDDHRIFDALVERLTTVGDASGTTYKCVCPDFSRGTSLKKNLRAAKEILLQQSALPSNKDGKVTIVAHDWGALLMWNLQDRHPQLVSRVVALSIPYRPGFISIYSHGLQAFFCFYQIWLAIAYTFGRWGFGPLPAIGDWMALTFMKWGFAPDQRSVTAPSRANLIPPVVRHSLLCYYYLGFHALALAALIFFPNSFGWKNRIPVPMNKLDVRVPALYMRGSSEEVWSSPEIEQRIAKSFPSSDVHVYPKSGHWFYLNEANKTDFLNRVTNFLSQ